MIRLRFVLVVALVLLGAPALMACEKCVPKGSLTPIGTGPFSSAICWTDDTGGWSYCTGGDSNCTGGDPENSCPTGGGGGKGLPVPEPQAMIPIDSMAKCIVVDLAGVCRAGGQELTSILE